MRPPPRCLFLLLTVLLSPIALPAADARADAPKAPSAPSPEAVAFFDEGRKLMAAGDYAGAIGKLEQSIAATRTVGALLNLGRCYEETGRMASAWATYRGAAALAREMRDGREADANRFVDQVRPKVSFLTIDARAVDGVPGLALRLDGVPVGPGARGEAMPIDAGTHRLEVTAPDKRKQTLAADVGKDGARATLTIAPLEDAPPDARASLPPAGPATEPPSHTARTVGFVLGGVGVVLAGAGAVTGFMAISKHSEAASLCSPYPDHCDPGGAANAPNRDSQTFATISTIGFVAGGAALATGIIVVLTAPRGERPSAALRLAPLVGRGLAGAHAEVAW